LCWRRRTSRPATRRVAIITEKLIGTEVASTQVSRAVAELDQQLQAWRERPLRRYKYLWLDSRYEKVRVGGLVRDAAVLMATGLNLEGKREVGVFPFLSAKQKCTGASISKV
jgi:transposase-like protein